VENQSLHYINEICARLVRTPGKPGDLNSVLQHIGQIAHDAFATDACVVLAFNPITSAFIGGEYVGSLQEGNELLLDRSKRDEFTQRVLREGIVLVEGLEVEPQWHNHFTRKEEICSCASLALRTRHRNRCLGIIYLDFKHPKKFSSADYASFQNFAIQASFLLEEAWLISTYEKIAHIGQEVNHNLGTIDELFQALQTYVDAVLDDSHQLMLTIYQSQTHTLDFRIREQGRSFSINQPLQGICLHVIETQEPLFIRQLSIESEQLLHQLDTIATEVEQKESLIFVPLMLRGVSLGVLSIQHALPDAYGWEDLFTLQLLANYVASALHNMRLYSSLYQLNETGQLLTQQLESEQTLQATVERIRDATQADIAILYPYESAVKRFILPPCVAGTLQDAGFPPELDLTPDDMAILVLHYKRPIFAKESATIYTILRGDTNVHQGNFQERENICSTAAVPLQVGDEMVGILFVNFRQQQRFDATQKLFIEGLAHYAAIAIKNAQVFGMLSLRRIHELEILQYIDRELNQTLELESILNTILRLAHEHVPSEEAAILLYNPEILILKTVVTSGRHAEARKMQATSLQRNRGIASWVVEHKKAARVNSVHKDLPWRDLYYPIALDIVSELDVPLLDGNNVIGVINFESIQEGFFRQEDQDFMLTLAGQAVLAIKNAQTYEREKRLAEEGQVLNEISKEITSQLDTNHIFDLILERALLLTRSTAGNLMIYDAERNDLWMATERGVYEDKRGQRQSLDQGVVGQVARSKQLLNITDISQSPWNELSIDFIPGTCSELATPMLAGKDLLGVLNVESRSPNNFTESDVRLLKGLADLAVIALQNAQAYEREKRLAEEAQVLNEISKEITSELDTTHIFGLILEKALMLTRSTVGNVMIYDPERNDLWMAAERGVSEDKKHQRQRRDQGIVGYVATRKQIYNVEDVSRPPWNKIYLAFSPGVHSELAVPMLQGNELRGVLNVESLTAKHFNDKDVRLLRGLADLAVIALQNAEHYKKAKQERQRFELLYKAEQELSKVTEWAKVEQAYNIILGIAEEHSQSYAVIYPYDKDSQELVIIHPSESQTSSQRERQFENLAINRQVAQERRALVIHDTADPLSHVISAQLCDPAMRSLFIMPIVFKDQYYGNLELRHKEVGHFRGTDAIFFEGLAQQLASTIYRLETAQSRQEFEKRALSAEEMSSIGQSAFEVTHRLGNDLGLVEFYVRDVQAELERLGVTNPYIDEKMRNIVQSVRAVLSFSKDLKKKLSKLGDKEEKAGEPVVIQPQKLLEDALTISSLPSNIEVDLEIDETVAPVKVFPSLVSDILRNLVANAIQAMPDGGKIILRARNVGRSVALEVADAGVGISEQAQSNIFDLFFSTKGSSGFGLWSARRNALKNHGDLKLISQVGRGATFQLLLPRIDNRMP
jgi:GAF domain-containing protein